MHALRPQQFGIQSQVQIAPHQLKIKGRKEHTRKCQMQDLTPKLFLVPSSANKGISLVSQRKVNELLVQYLLTAEGSQAGQENMSKKKIIKKNTTKLFWQRSLFQSATSQACNLGAESDPEVSGTLPQTAPAIQHPGKQDTLLDGDRFPPKFWLMPKG